MTETRSSRANTPRSRAPQRPSQAARRASSVPAVGSKKPEYILDCVLMTPRKRKRTTSHEDPPSGPASQPQASRLGALACLQKKPAARTARSRARSTDKDSAPASSRTSTRSQSRKRASSPAAPPEKAPRRRAASTSRTSNASTAEGSASQRRRTSSRASVAPGKAAPPSRASASSARRNKGKARVSQVQMDFEASSQPDTDDRSDAPSGTRRAAKRRRLSPRLVPESPEFSPTGTVVGVDAESQGTAVEEDGEDFQMLDMPDDASLPWVPMDPQTKESTYVPPGLNALIEDMKRALVLQMSARQKAEALHAEEMRRRRELELEAARLAAANRALEEERSVWTTSAAEALACTLESALVADRTRRRAGEVGAPPDAFDEGMLEDAEMSGVEVRSMPDGAFAAAGTVLGTGPEARNTELQLQDRSGLPTELVLTMT